LCFNPFKIVLKKEKDENMTRKNYYEPNKLTPTKMDKQGIMPSIVPKEIMLKFKVIKIDHMILRPWRT
jgi:hypothetical protein